MSIFNRLPAGELSVDPVHILLVASWSVPLETTLHPVELLGLGNLRNPWPKNDTCWHPIAWLSVANYGSITNLEMYIFCILFSLEDLPRDILLELLMFVLHLTKHGFNIFISGIETRALMAQLTVTSTWTGRGTLFLKATGGEWYEDNDPAWADSSMTKGPLVQWYSWGSIYVIVEQVWCTTGVLKEKAGVIWIWTKIKG